MASLNLRTLTIALIGLSCTHLTIAQTITNHEDLLRSSINKDQATGQLKKLEPVVADVNISGVIGYDASYEADAGLGIQVENGQSVVISPREDDEGLSVVAIPKPDVSGQRSIQGIKAQLGDNSKLRILPKLQVSTKDSNSVYCGVRFTGKDSSEINIEQPISVFMPKKGFISGFSVEGGKLSTTGLEITAGQAVVLNSVNYESKGTVEIRAISGVMSTESTFNHNGNFSLIANYRALRLYGGSIVLDASDGFIDIESPELVMLESSATLSLNEHGGARVSLFANNKDTSLHDYSKVKLSDRGSFKLRVDNPESEVKLEIIGPSSLESHSSGESSIVVTNKASASFKITGQGSMSAVTSLSVEKQGNLEVEAGSVYSLEPVLIAPISTLSVKEKGQLVWHANKVSHFYVSKLIGDEEGTGVMALPIDFGAPPVVVPGPVSLTLENKLPLINVLNDFDGHVRLVLDVKNYKPESNLEKLKFMTLHVQSYLQKYRSLPLKEIHAHLNEDVKKFGQFFIPEKSCGTLHCYSFDVELGSDYEALVAQNDALPSLYITNVQETSLSQPSDLVDALIGIESANLLTLQAFNDTLYDRLGDIRVQPSDHLMGLWVRSSHSQARKNGFFGFNSRQERIDFGWDKRIHLMPGSKAWVGLTLQWQNLDLKNPYTHLNNHLMNVGAYASVMNDAGWYADWVARVGKYMTDNAPITISGGTQDQSRQLEQISKNNPWLFNSSFEFGRRFRFHERFFVEPQAQLNYSYLRHRDLALSEVVGSQVNQWVGQADADESLVGRVGVAFGYTFVDADKNPIGSMYARLNYHREFLGQLGIKLESAQSNAPDAVEAALSLALPYRKQWLSIDSGISHQLGRSWLLYGGARWTFKGIADRAWELNFGARYAF